MFFISPFLCSYFCLSVGKFMQKLSVWIWLNLLERWNVQKKNKKKVQITFLKIVIGHWPWQKIALGVPFQLNQFGDVRTQSQQE